MTIDPGAQKMLDILRSAQAKGVPMMHEVSPSEARAMHLRSKELFGSDGPEMWSNVDLEIPVADANIGARLYRPHENVAPLIVYLHGGGWVVGDLDSHDGLCRAIAAQSRCTVLSVDYRLAPEHPFPTPLEDVYTALTWAVDNADQLAADTTRLAVAGDSAGGNLAAAVCQLARARSGPDIAYQALLYPVTDSSMDSDSFRGFTEHLLTPESMAWFFDQYAPNLADRADWRVAPLKADDVSGLPPALVLTAGFDPLRDEGQAYAERLTKAGVPTTYRCYEGQLHGFLTLDKVITQANDAIAEISEHLCRALN
jgi:acetyl esterase